MKVLAVTCLTGGPDLVAMAQRCLDGIRCTNIGIRDLDMRFSVIAQGVDGDCAMPLASWIKRLPENRGFAAGMNLAIEQAVAFGHIPEWILCFNTDLEFPNHDWLRTLLSAASPKRIVCPATDKTALYKQRGPLDRNPFDTQEVSAYCWLVPFAWCEFLKETYGFWLFDEDFFAFGEDNWTSFLLAKRFGPQIFRIVPRAFVRHLRSKTSSIVKPSRTASSRLLVDKLRRELKHSELRPDLRRWAERYVKILSRSN